MIRQMTRVMRQPAALLTALGSTLLMASAATAADGNVDLPRFPAVSPDGAHVTFSWRGDLWKVSSDGGHAQRLTAHAADEHRSAWSADGSRIAFESNRDGFQNIYVMNADGTDIHQVSDTDRPCNLTGFARSADGSEILTFSGVLEGDVYRSERPYMISAAGGDIVRMFDAFGSQPGLDASGQRTAFVRGGYYYGLQRRHGRGPETMDVWVHDASDDSYHQVTSWAGHDAFPQWVNDTTLAFISDRENRCQNLYTIQYGAADDTARRRTNFTDADIHGLSISGDGTTAVMAVWDTLYVLDLTDANAQARAITVTATEDEADNYALIDVNRRVEQASLSPDGKVMAYIAYGEVYVRNVDDGSPTRRVTDSHSRERDVAWSPDGLTLYFTSDRDGTWSIYGAHVERTRSEIKDAFNDAVNGPEEEEADDEDGGDEEEGEDAGDDDADDDEGDDAEEGDEEDGPDPSRWHDAIEFSITPIVQSQFNDRRPKPSPDGSALSFSRTRGDIVVRDLETGAERTILSSWDFFNDWRWSPDGNWIAYSTSDLDFNADIFVVPADGSADPVNITKHPDNDENPRFSADSKVLVFTSERVNEEYDVYSVYLDKDLEAMTSLELEAYYEERGKAVKKLKPLPVASDEDDEDADDDDASVEALDLDDAWLRLRRITSLTGNEGNVEITPAGDRIIFSGNHGGSGLFSVKYNGSDRKRLGSAASVQHLSLKGDKIVVVSGSRAGTMGIGGGSVSYVDIDDTMRIDLQEQASQKFIEAARDLGDFFYHPDLKGIDYEGLKERYHALARQSRTVSEFNEVANRFLGELTASHMGVRSRGGFSSDVAQSHGRLGTVHHRVTLDDGRQGFHVDHVVPRSPASRGDMALHDGDVITKIEGEGFSSTDTVESRLTGRAGVETIVTVHRTLHDGTVGDVDLLITPTSFGAMRNYDYLAWREHKARLVEEWSDGRLGYIHVQGMNQPSLDVFERDLFAACDGKDGLIVDVRNNGGGWTTDRLLSSIMVRPHAYTIPRGADPNDIGHYPQDRLFIARYTLPMNSLCNEKSFSNAEIFSHAFKALDRGNVVGQETWGGVISTGGFSLIDGTTVRLPFRGWYLNDGTDMENHGCVPDILVPQTPEAEASQDDEQLRAAVEDLLNRIN